MSGRFRLEVLDAICSIQVKRCSAPYAGFVVNDSYGLHVFFALPVLLVVKVGGCSWPSSVLQAISSIWELGILIAHRVHNILEFDPLVFFVISEIWSWKFIVFSASVIISNFGSWKFSIISISG